MLDEDVTPEKVNPQQCMIELWDHFLRELEGPEENTPLSDEPFEHILEYATRTVFDLETRDPYPTACRKAIFEAIATLSPKQLFALKKIFFEGQTEQQVADSIGITQKAVNFRKIRGLLQIENNPHVQLLKNALVGGTKQKRPSDPFERIDRAFERGEITKDEKYRLWAMFEVGALRGSK
jgi:hypothetical protein